MLIYLPLTLVSRCTSFRNCLAFVFALVAVAVSLAWHMWPEICCDHIQLSDAPFDVGNPCGRSIGENLSLDLSEKGYTAVPGVLTAEEAKAFKAIVEQLPWSEHQVGYKFASTEKLAAAFSEQLAQKMRWVIASIQQDSDIRVAREDDASDLFSIRSGSNLMLHHFLPDINEFIITNASDLDHSAAQGWHLDNMGWYISQQSRNYLNMYLIIDKPDPADAGLMVIPRDVLRSRSPRLFNLTQDSGAMYLLPNVEGTQTLLCDNSEYDHYFLLDYNIEDFACVPGLRTGDLLVVRGDTLHRTQSALRSSRVALSFRVFPDKYDNEKMLTGGFLKYARLLDSLPLFMDRAVKNAVGQSSRSPLLEWEIFLRVHVGYWYRRILLPVREFTGMLIGEPMLPVPSY